MITKYQKKYIDKNREIKKMLKFDFNNLIEKKLFNGENRTFLIGENIPLSSFSRWCEPLFNKKFELIPNFAIKKASNFGSKLMESLEHFALFGDFESFEFEQEQVKNVSWSIIKILAKNNFKIIECEKLILDQNLKMSGYIDLIVWDNLKKKYIAIEIKTRNKEFIKVDDITKAQAFFYKQALFNIKTMILVIDRKNENNYILETLNYHKGLEAFNTIKNYWNLAK